MKGGSLPTDPSHPSSARMDRRRPFDFKNGLNFEVKLINPEIVEDDIVPSGGYISK
jgi:hypothetical protein